MSADGRPYDIAVLDMCMPGTDGLQLAQTISADRTLFDTKIILLTSTLVVDPVPLREAGVREWLTKPVRDSELFDGLMRVMALHTRRRAATEPAYAANLPSPDSLGRVLEVEDNGMNQLVAEGIVTALGYQVDIVSNGVEALQAQAADSYVAILMDCHMPLMDGYEATREIRRREGQGPRTPVIAMTASAMTDDRDRCIAAGMDDYISKPATPRVLRQTLETWARQPPEAARRPIGAAAETGPVVSALQDMPAVNP